MEYYKYKRCLHEELITRIEFIGIPEPQEVNDALMQWRIMSKHSFDINPITIKIPSTTEITINAISKKGVSYSIEIYPNKKTTELLLYLQTPKYVLVKDKD